MTIRATARRLVPAMPTLCLIRTQRITYDVRSTQMSLQRRIISKERFTPARS